MRQLVKADNVVLCRLIIIHVGFVLKIPTVDYAAVDKRERVRRLVIGIFPSRVDRKHCTKNRTLQLRIGLSEYNLLAFRIFQRVQHSVDNLPVTLAAARRPAKQYLGCLCLNKFLLLFRNL